MWALLINSVVAVTAPEMVARTLDGREVIGIVTELIDGRVVIKTGEKTVTIKADAILSLNPTTSPTPVNLTDPALYRVELIDGSLLKIDDYTVTNGQVRLTLRGRSELISSRVISVVRFKQGTDNTKKQWVEILANRDAKKTSGDVIVIRRSENNVDSLEGEFQDVLEKGGKMFVEFDLGDGPVDVAFDRVDGMVYFHAAPPRFDDPVCVVTDADGAQLRVKSISLSDGILELETLAGLKTTRALKQVRSLDFSAGKVVYLSVPGDVASDELAPLRKPRRRPNVEGIPRTDEAKRIQAAIQKVQARWHRPRKNRWGINIETGKVYGLVLRGTLYARGLAVRSRTVLDYPLRKRFRRFHAVVGIDDKATRQGHIRLLIQADDKTIFEGAFSGQDESKKLDLNVEGVSRLVILVDYGEGGDQSDYFDLCEARVTK